MEGEQAQTADNATLNSDLLTSTLPTRTSTTASSFDRELVLDYSESESSELNNEDGERLDSVTSPVMVSVHPVPMNSLVSEDTAQINSNRLVSENTASVHSPKLVSEHTAPEDIPRLVSEPTIECLMSEQEIKEWDKRLQECTDRLKIQMEEHTKWESGLNSRKQMLSTRLKRLQEHYNNRRHLYACVEEYVQNVNTRKSSNVAPKRLDP